MSRRISCLVLALLLLGASRVTAHEGHADAPGAESVGAAEGPVRVTEVARRNLGLETAEAELRTLEKTLDVIGEIRAEPFRSATVSSRIAGRVVSIHAREGDSVRRGQRLVVIESFQLGSPPPRVSYAALIEGTITDRHVVVGDDVERNGHLFEIADLSEVLAVGRVFEGQIADVAVGQKVRVRVPSLPGVAFEGSVERLGGQLDEGTRSLPVYVRVANADGRLRPHMRATLSLVTEQAELALAVPRSAVLGEFGHSFVFVEGEDRERFERRNVVTGIADDRWVEIIEGVLPGERVVTVGNYSLQYLEPESAEADEEEAHDHAEAEAHAGQTAPFAASSPWLWGAAGIVAGILLGAFAVAPALKRAR